jgi:hypothetical protein
MERLPLSRVILLSLMLFFGAAEGATEPEDAEKKPGLHIGIFQKDYNTLVEMGFTSSKCIWPSATDEAEINLVSEAMGETWNRVRHKLFPEKEVDAITVFLYFSGAETIEKAFNSIPDFLQIIIRDGIIDIVEASADEFDAMGHEADPGE